MSNFYTIYQLEQFVNRHTHGSGVTSAESFFGSVDDGRLEMTSKIKPPELIRTGYLEDALYGRVNRYSTPEDMKYDDIIQIRKLSSYHNVDTNWKPLTVVYRRAIDSFGNARKSNMVNIGYDNGVKYVTINHPEGLKDNQQLIINRSDSLTENGTWNVGGNVVNLRLDELNHISKNASIKFDINNSSTSGFIQNITMKSFSLKDYLNKGAVFEWLNLTIPQNMVSVKLTMGSDLSNLNNDIYFSSVNQPHDNNMFATGWNLLKYMMNNISQIGTPNPDDLKFIQIDFITTGDAIPNCNIDAITARQGEVYEITYNSRWCLIDADTRAWKQFATKGSDMIVAEEDTYRLFGLEVSLTTQQEIYGNGAGAAIDVTNIESKLQESYQTYKMQHKGEAIEPQQATRRYGRMNYGYYGNGRGVHYDHYENGDLSNN